jgi:hypothetical protein
MKRYEMRRDEMSRDLYGDLESMDDLPEFWTPIPGEILVGSILDYDKYHGQFGPTPIVVVKEEKSGTVYNVRRPAMLDSQFTEKNPPVGARIGIRYFGKHPDKGYHRYKLMVDAPEPPPQTTPVPDEDVPF